VFWAATGAIGGTDVAESGMTRVNEETGISNVLTTASSERENDLLDGLSAAAWPPLPGVGEPLEAGVIYSYGDICLMVRQSHNRMHYDPLDTPALFIVWREDAGEALEWIAGEQVYVGTWRTYDDALYECLQQHVTQADWTPDVVPALWRVVPTTAEWQPYVYYEIGVHVMYLGTEYECRQSHTSLPGWEPPNVPALWVAV
jgi:hypothetical protein